MKSTKDIFIPDVNNIISENDIWAWYNNILHELELIDFMPRERIKIIDYYKDAGLFCSSRRNYFRRHYSHSFTEAVKFLLGSSVKKPKILDLGVGFGSQAILLGLMGAEIIGLDLDDEALAIAEKRCAFYEKVSGRKILFGTLCQNSFDVNYSQFAPIDGVYSMFAFNMMQPSNKLLMLMQESFSNTMRFAIIDGNNQCLYSKLLPSRRRKVWSPEEFRSNIEEMGFSIFQHSGKVSLPPYIWSLGMHPLTIIDNMLNSTWIFPVSHQILAQKTS